MSILVRTSLSEQYGSLLGTAISKELPGIRIVPTTVRRQHHLFEDPEALMALVAVISGLITIIEKARQVWGRGLGADSVESIEKSISVELELELEETVDLHRHMEDGRPAMIIVEHRTSKLRVRVKVEKKNGDIHYDVQ